MLALLERRKRKKTGKGHSESSENEDEVEMEKKRKRSERDALIKTSTKFAADIKKYYWEDRREKQ